MTTYTTAMIEYKYPEEKAVTFYYVKQLSNSLVLSILEKGYAENSHEARHLAKFFWQMVDQTVIDVKEKKHAAGYTNLEACCEDIMQSFSAYFMCSGFSKEWEEESDKA